MPKAEPLLGKADKVHVIVDHHAEARHFLHDVSERNDLFGENRTPLDHALAMIHETRTAQPDASQPVARRIRLRDQRFNLLGADFART